jgi:hypothetical protein
MWENTLTRLRGLEIGTIPQLSASPKAMTRQGSSPPS